MNDTMKANERVEVWNPSTRHWSKGFVIDSMSKDGVLVKRVFDNFVLPKFFKPTEIRKEGQRRFH